MDEDLATGEKQQVEWEQEWHDRNGHPHHRGKRDHHSITPCPANVAIPDIQRRKDGPAGETRKAGFLAVGEENKYT
ncbi:MAG: hypothetical protein R2854_15240 [Caldilineaceae bacterium]